MKMVKIFKAITTKTKAMINQEHQMIIQEYLKRQLN